MTDIDFSDPLYWLGCLVGVGLFYLVKRIILAHRMANYVREGSVYTIEERDEIVTIETTTVDETDETER